MPTSDIKKGPLYVDSTNNRVGVGTSSPATALDVTGAITTDGLTSEAANGTITSKASGASFCSFTANTSAGNNAYVFFQQAGTEMSRITAYNGDTLAFSTGSGAAERLRIDSSGNVLHTVAYQGSAFVPNTPSTWNALEIFQDRGVTNSASGIAFRSQSGTAPAGIVSVAGNTTGGIESLAFMTSTGNATAEAMRIDSSGNLLVGTTSANATEKFNATSASTEVAFFQNSSNTSGYSGIRSQIGSGGSNTSTWHYRGETRGYANWYLYGNGTTSYSSDIRLKKNVQTARGYLEDLNKLRVVKYQWKGEDPDCQQVELGLIAQEVEEVFPNLIQEHEIEGVGNIKHIKQSVLPFMMLKAIQEQQAIIEALTARVVALEAN